MARLLPTLEFRNLRQAGIFPSTEMAAPLTSETNIETAEDNGSSRNCCLEQPVKKYIIALPTAGRTQKEESGHREKLGFHNFPQTQQQIAISIFSTIQCMREKKK